MCGRSEVAARDFKNYICGELGYAADYINTGNGEVGLAIHRNESPSCSSYDNTLNFVPTSQMYPERRH